MEDWVATSYPVSPVPSVLKLPPLSTDWLSLKLSICPMAIDMLTYWLNWYWSK